MYRGKGIKGAKKSDLCRKGIIALTTSRLLNPSIKYHFYLQMPLIKQCHAAISHDANS